MDEHTPAVPNESAPELQENLPTPTPALTITIQSWATPVVGLAMLALGLLAGYFGRPFVDPASSLSSRTAARSPATPDPSLGVSGDQETRQQALMEAIIPQTVHFKGNPGAPVTLIEFSDFQ